MTKKVLTLALVPMLIAGCSSENSPKQESGQQGADPEWELTTELDLTEGDEKTVDVVNGFSHRLMAEAQAASADGGFCVSPLSVSVYLGMLANATAGESHDQIMEALGSNDIDALNSLFEKLMHYLPCDENGSSIGIANRFWVDGSLSVPDSFTGLAAKVFNAGVEYVDFGDSGTVPAINKWVYDNTGGKIPSLLDGDWKDYASMRMASANTVYFKGDWDVRFDPEKSTEGTFHGVGGDSKARMMHNTVRTGYAENGVAQVVSLWFQGVSVMELYLPANGTDIRDFASTLTADMCEELREAKKRYDVTLSLPSFEKSSQTDLAAILGRMGVRSLDRMDLTPMGLGVMPTSVIHKTSIRIDEKGAELAAMTGGWAGAASGEVDKYPEVTLDFDRPFLYIIRNHKTGAILMAGMVTGI